MGYFTDINNSSNRAQGVAEYNRANGVNGHTALGVIASQYGPSIFMSLTSKIASSSDGKGGADDKNLSVEEQKKTLEKQLDKALSAVGVDNVNAIETALSAQTTKVDNAQKSKEAFYNNTDKYSTDIQNLQAQKFTGANLTEEQISKNKQLDKDIKALEKEREQARKTAENEYAKEVKIFQNMSVNADKAKNINIQLQNLKVLKDSDKIETKYDVKQEVTDLSDFNKAREKFLKKPSKETAIALDEAFKSVDSEKTKEAYNKYLKASVELWKSFNN